MKGDRKGGRKKREVETQRGNLRENHDKHINVRRRNFNSTTTTQFFYKCLFYRKKEEEVTARCHLRKLLSQVGSCSSIFVLSFSESALIVCRTFGSVVMLKNFFGWT